MVEVRTRELRMVVGQGRLSLLANADVKGRAPLADGCESLLSRIVGVA